MNPSEKFQEEVKANIAGLGEDEALQELSRLWCAEVSRHKYAYNFSWLGRPAIQFPNDAWALQEIIWQVRPDLIIEAGIAHGGSLVFSASMLSLLDLTDAIAAGQTMNPAISRRKVLGIDIDIRAHNRKAIEAHPMASRIQMIEGSSIAEKTIAQVKSVAANYDRILVCLDSNHTHEHVLAELHAYAGLTSIGSYCVVLDTLVDDMPEAMFNDRPWGPGNSPKSAVKQYLKSHPEFEVDAGIHHKLLITVAPDGYLKRIK
ncbi:MAG: cephalosporin hydroxylase family protein [Pseudomonadales bacterium]|nr:cephalosporin hydroxylase family protein [Halioglobus sp.]MCP5121752.1 cephalosporin hydroxylase family protein [Pseudomonadales bacterium]MCP5194202.1 cephalosporin hydroxylase family protein [Pseudomonadales bacterium]